MLCTQCRGLLAVLLLTVGCQQGDSIPMKVIFKQSGGYAPPATLKKCVVDTDSMQAAEAESLHSMVHGSGLMELEDKERKSSKGADLMKYEIVIETSEGTTTFSFDDMTAPQEGEQLLDFLLERCN